MMDLYKILRVPRNASKDRIQKSFRKLSRQLHPDVGGDAESFQQLHKAYTVLMDDERRSKYDLTGEVDLPRADNAIAEVLGVLSPVLTSVIVQLVKRGLKPESQDMVALMHEAIGSGLRDFRQQKAEAQKLLDGFKETQGRFTVDEGENWLETVAQMQVQQFEGQVKQLDAQIRVAEAARTFLKKFKYHKNAAVLQSFLGTAATTSMFFRTQ